MLKIVDYSEKAIAVTGDTKPHKEALKSLGGKFNPALKCGSGWIFSKKQSAKVEAYVQRIAQNPTSSPEPSDFFDLDAYNQDQAAQRIGA
jgi:hypothetical protein